MDAAALASALAAALAPYLPYLLKAGEKAAEGAVTKFGSDGWDGARALWNKLRPAAEGRPEILSAAHDMAEALPDQAADAEAALRFQLRKLLNAHPELVADLQAATERLHGQVQMIVSGTRAVGVANMHGGSVHTGDVVSGSLQTPRDGD